MENIPEYIKTKFFQNVDNFDSVETDKIMEDKQEECLQEICYNFDIDAVHWYYYNWITNGNDHVCAILDDLVLLYDSTDDDGTIKEFICFYIFVFDLSKEDISDEVTEFIGTYYNVDDLISKSSKYNKHQNNAFNDTYFMHK